MGCQQCLFKWVSNLGSPHGITIGNVESRFSIACLLIEKVIYELKQALGAWYPELHSFLSGLGFTTSRVDT